MISQPNYELDVKNCTNKNALNQVKKESFQNIKEFNTLSLLNFDKHYPFKTFATFCSILQEQNFKRPNVRIIVQHCASLCNIVQHRKTLNKN